VVAGAAVVVAGMAETAGAVAVAAVAEAAVIKESYPGVGPQ